MLEAFKIFSFLLSMKTFYASYWEVFSGFDSRKLSYTFILSIALFTAYFLLRYYRKRFIHSKFSSSCSVFVFFTLFLLCIYNFFVKSSAYFEYKIFSEMVIEKVNNKWMPGLLKPHWWYTHQNWNFNTMNVCEYPYAKHKAGAVREIC